MSRSVVSLLLLHFNFIFPLITAHFVLNYPPSLGFDANNEDVGPCSGFPISLTNTTDFHVGGDSIGLSTLHPQSNFLFRGSVNLTGDSKNLNANNWVVLLPVVLEAGLGTFCEKSVAVPSNWAGQQGVLQVEQNAEDGVHYQCAVVSFVAGVPPSIPKSCTNVTGLNAYFTSDTTLLPESSSATGTAGSTAASTSGTVTSASATVKSSSSRFVVAGNGISIAVVCATYMALLW